MDHLSPTSEFRQNPRAAKLTIKLVFGLVFVWSLYVLVRLLVGRVSSINPTVGAAIVAGLVATFGYLYTQYQTKLREIAEAHRTHKVEVYGYLLQVIEIMAQMPEENPLAGRYDFPVDKTGLLAKFNSGVIAWGSPEVIYLWLRVRHVRSGETSDALMALDSLLWEIRSDLGNSNYGLLRGDLVSLFFKNPENISDYR